MSCLQAEQLKIAKEGVLAFFHSVHQSCQHALRPDPGFGPRPALPQGVRTGLLSRRHCHRLLFPGSSLHASTFLPPFAPRALPRFIAPMRALTSAVPASPTRALTRLRISMLRLPGLKTIPSPTTFTPCPCRRLHTTPIAAGFPITRQTRRIPGVVVDRVWISPLPSRLTGRLGRNGFALLRTGRSPPVASHLMRSSIPCRAVEAVTFRYRAESDSLKRTSTSLTKQTHTRTRLCFSITFAAPIAHVMLKHNLRLLCPTPRASAWVNRAVSGRG